MNYLVLEYRFFESATKFCLSFAKKEALNFIIHLIFDLKSFEAALTKQKWYSNSFEKGEKTVPVLQDQW